ncbi:hypothetical protein [Pedobacter boryungensis]|uniref:Uncharacterized protein n=1 Tax=Pedobacter boryungensis TaxID=869962 RepID=A0ABX2D8X0_9SPHI|nr:hypothetical protein [Pedobacter boryungensis]NQX30500.1 hypothetical protein [Pedobacter boryungensis]
MKEIEIEKKIQSILKKIYIEDEGVFNSKSQRIERIIKPTCSRSEFDLLESRGLIPNRFETFEHDNALERLLTFQYDSKVTLDYVASLFLKGLTGELLRGRQPLMSFTYIKNLKPHAFTGDTHCVICGLPKKQTIDKTYQLYTYYRGESTNQDPINFLIDLEEIRKFDTVQRNQADNQKAAELLEVILASENSDVPWELEKRIAKNSVIPDADRDKRYGILQTLAECGILENDFIQSKYDEFTTQMDISHALKNVRTSHRSNIPLPYGAWRGTNGINFNRFHEIFGK